MFRFLFVLLFFRIPQVFGIEESKALQYFPLRDLTDHSITQGLDFIICFQGLRPDLPKNVHPKLLDLMQRCWETDPVKRPPFTEIKVELENLLEEVQVAYIYNLMVNMQTFKPF